MLENERVIDKAKLLAALYGLKSQLDIELSNCEPTNLNVLSIGRVQKAVLEVINAIQKGVFSVDKEAKEDKKDKKEEVVTE